MYTFARERETEAAGRFVAKPDERVRIHALTDAIPTRPNGSTYRTKCGRH